MHRAFLAFLQSPLQSCLAFVRQVNRDVLTWLHPPDSSAAPPQS